MQVSKLLRNAGIGAASLVLAGVMPASAEVEVGETVLGIDLGTTFSVASVYSSKLSTVQIVQMSGKNTMPSVIYVQVDDMTPEEKKEDLQALKKGEREYMYNGIHLKRGLGKKVKTYVGWDAFKMNEIEPSADKYFYRFKPLLARDPSQAIDRQVYQSTLSHVKYGLDVKETEDPAKRGQQVKTVGMMIKDKGMEIGWMTPKNASRLVLLELKSTVISKFAETNQCVVTVPAYFNDEQKRETREAAREAGLSIFDDGIINEPTSAAMAYAYTIAAGELDSGKPVSMKGLEFLVFDWGGGTLDLSYLNFGDQTLAADQHAGDNFLGGENVNDEIYKYFVGELIKQKKIAAHKDLHINTQLRLRRTVEKMKIELCDKQNVIDDELRKTAEQENTSAGGKKKAYKVDYTGEGKNASVTKKFQYKTDSLDTAELTLTTEKFNELISGLLERIRQLIFNVARDGADEENGLLAKADKKPEDISRVLYVGGSSRIPAVRRLLMEIFPAADHCFKLDADTCVSTGAAYHAAGLAGLISEDKYIALVDALPMNMGIRLDQDIFDVMARAGTSVPNKFTKIFTTTADAQKTVRIEVGQATTETRLFSKTKSVGVFELHMPDNSLPKGQKMIEVTFDFHSGGDIEVEASEIGPGQKDQKNTTKIIIKKNATQMDDEEIQRMNEEFEKTRYEEQQIIMKYEAQKKLEGMMETAKTQGANFGPAQAEAINALVSKTQIWLSTEAPSASAEEIGEKTTQFETDLAAIFGGKIETEGEEEGKENVPPVQEEEAKEEETAKEEAEYIPREEL